MNSDIKHVYVLGHSMGVTDIGYFKFLVNCTSVPKGGDGKVSVCDVTEERDPLNELHLRLQYAINRTGYGIKGGEISAEEMAAIEWQFAIEQSIRSEAYQMEFMKMISRGRNKTKKAMTPVKAEPRTEDAMRHILYFSEKDRLWIENIMKEYGCKKYRLYPSIDECLSQMKFND